MRPSRYEPARGFQPLPDGTVPFDGILPRTVPVPDGAVEHVVASGDRLDALATNYYNDSRLWYRILDANPQIDCGTDVVDPDIHATAAAHDPAIPDRQRRQLRPNLVGTTIVIPPAPPRGPA